MLRSLAAESQCFHLVRILRESVVGPRPEFEFGSGISRSCGTLRYTDPNLSSGLRRAVRKAYEILTNPKWAAYYQKYGLNQHCAMETNKNQCSLHEKQVSGASEPANASKTDFPTTEINLRFKVD